MLRSFRKPTIAIRYVLFGLTAAFMVLVAAACAQQPGAAAYPSRPVDAVVTFSAGGSLDRLMRFTAPYLQEEWGQPVNVVNMTGAGGATGTTAVLQAPPDGYMMGVFGDANGYLGSTVQTDFPYQWDDLNHVALIAIQPLVFIVKGDSEYDSLDDLVNDIQQAPQDFTYGSSGVAGPSQFAIAQMLGPLGVDIAKLRRVPFDGGSLVAAAVAGGHVDMAAQYTGEVIELIRGGQLKPLAVSFSERWQTLPDVPTFEELGYESPESTGPFGIFGPADLPAEVVQRWEDTLAALVQDPEYVAGLREIGAAPRYMNSEEFRALIEGEYQTALEIVESLGLRK